MLGPFRCVITESHKADVEAGLWRKFTNKATNKAKAIYHAKYVQCSSNTGHVLCNATHSSHVSSHRASSNKPIQKQDQQGKDMCHAKCAQMLMQHQHSRAACWACCTLKPIDCLHIQFAGYCCGKAPFRDCAYVPHLQCTIVTASSNTEDCMHMTIRAQSHITLIMSQLCFNTTTCRLSL